jgi:hypothetical protein
MLPLFSSILLKPKSHDVSCQLWLAMTHQSFSLSVYHHVSQELREVHIGYIFSVWWSVSTQFGRFYTVTCCRLQYVSFPTYTLIPRLCYFHISWYWIACAFCTHCLYFLFLWVEQSHLSLSCSYPHTNVTILCKNLTNALIYVNATLVLSCMIIYDVLLII